jgi:tRNA-specific 2-thiouridylase
VLNFAEHFEDTVVSDFHRAYAAGQTPNPCVRCNQWVKFGALMQRAEALGADVLATGHYARIRTEGDRHRLLRGVDQAKDQSYVLWMLTQAELAASAFPVGEMEKTRTRAMAADLGLRTAAKPDSQEICFVRDGDMAAYVSESMPDVSREGVILDGDGAVVGNHTGIGRYTVGQRKGLGISLGRPVFVNKIDAATNSITVGSRSDLAVSGFDAAEASFVFPIRESRRVMIQHRAHGEVNPGTVSIRSSGKIRVIYDRPVDSVAPGQSAALYDTGGAELLGGGIIASTFPVEETVAS